MKGFWTGTVEGIEWMEDVVRMTVRGISPSVGGIMGFRRIVIADAAEGRNVRVGSVYGVLGETTKRGDIMAEHVYQCF